MGLAFIAIACYHVINKKPTSKGDVEGVSTMTNITNQDAHDDVSCAELIAMIRDAARDGRLSVEDLRELREYAVQILREGDGTPEAEIA